MYEPYLRSEPTLTLEAFREQVSEPVNRSRIDNNSLKFSVEGDRHLLTFQPPRAKSDKTVVLEEQSVARLAEWFEIPRPFLLKSDPHLQQKILSHVVEKAGGESLMIWSDKGDGGIVEMRNPAHRVIEKEQVVDAVANVLDPKALIVEAWTDPRNWRFDVIVPEGYDRGVGGDRKVGDIAVGGLRVGQDRHHNLAPWVEQFIYRLACTNGMEIADPTTRIDARGQTVDEVLAELEATAERVFSAVEGSIKEFYDLRHEKVENVEAVMLRFTQEQEIPDRLALAMSRGIASVYEGDGQATMFDVVNYVTNQANDPEIQNRSSSRRNLELAGGNILTQHIERCGTCRSALRTG